MMLQQWNAYGVLDLLKQAWKRGIIMSGLSAGGICWYESGLCDYDNNVDTKTITYSEVYELGIQTGIFCSHLDSECRRYRSFLKLIASGKKVGIACDDGAAVWNQEGSLPMVKCAKPGAEVHVFRPMVNGVSIEVYNDGDEILIPEPSRNR